MLKLCGLTVNVGQREAWEGASYEGDLYKKYETGSTIRYKLGGHFQCQVYALAHNKLEGGLLGRSR